MRRPLRWRVYSAPFEGKRGRLMAATRDGVAAAELVALYGPGATIRTTKGEILWTEGSESQEAGESFDFVEETIYVRAELAEHEASWGS